MKKILQKIYDIHDIKCNQSYGDNLPYSFHLKSVVAQANRYFPINYEKIDPETFFPDVITHKNYVIIAAAGHDLIEDARLTYNDITTFTSSFTADIIYACTEEKGKNRKERHSDKFFNDLSMNRWAVYIKLCDVMANSLFSLLVGSGMYEKYKIEFPNLYNKLYKPNEFDHLWNDLKIIL
jgi:(p)ppGpp synthase/HD superfamily hydrolase